MKCLKLFGLSLVAAAAMTTFASSASADYVSETTGGAAGTWTIHAVNEGGHVSLASSSGFITCGSTVHATVTSHGAGVPVAGHIVVISFSNCTDGWTVVVNAGGSLSVSATSGHNGTVSSTGTTVTAIRHTIFGTVECRYSTNNTHIGTVTGGNPATLKIEGKIPFHSGGGLCGEGTAQWTGNYVTTSALYVARS